jgi:hypothetical protein
VPDRACDISFYKILGHYVVGGRLRSQILEQHQKMLGASLTLTQECVPGIKGRGDYLGVGRKYYREQAMYSKNILRSQANRLAQRSLHSMTTW